MTSATTSYSSLRRAQLTYEYLHTNSTTHEFLFGALAELVDNARDASSTKIDIYTEPCETCRGKFILYFLDDGDGMDPSEVGNVVQFGRSVKRNVDSRMIGQYGNGLKSGTMRIGKDMILFTKKGNTMSCLFLSRTFHEREKIEEVVVPMPSWEVSSKKPLAKSKRELEKHQVETNLILKYSPFKTETQMFEQFDKIGLKGTLVVVYNLKLMDNGEPELDIVSDPYDIKMADPYAGENVADYDMIMPERSSFRAYSAILYLDPRMKIYIQKKKVQTKKLTACLHKTKCYYFTSKRFKTRSEKEAEKADREAKIAEEKARELEIQAREIQEQAEQTSKDKRVELRKAQALASEARADANLKTKIADAKKKSMKEPKTLSFTFGMNIDNRRCYGMFIYNCSRLIRMYERVGPQLEGGVKCYGVIGVVDVPYLVLEPTHNKQDFADGKEFKHLTRALGEHLEQFWKDSQIESYGVTKFWENFGYISSRWTDGPSVDQKYARKRAMQIPVDVQCDICLKWRRLPFSQRNVGRTLPDEWCCAMHPDPNCNSCSRPEQKVAIPVGVLQKQVKTAEEKERELAQSILKNQEKIRQIQRQSTPQAATESNRIQPQAISHKKVERTSSTESSNSSKSDSSEKRRPPRKAAVAESTDEHRRKKSVQEPLKRRNAESSRVAEEVQPKRKKNDETNTKSVDRKENQVKRKQERPQREEGQESPRQQKKETSRQESKEPPKQERETLMQEKQQPTKREVPKRETPKQQELRTEIPGQQELAEMEQIQQEQLMEWSSEGESEGTLLSNGTKVEARVEGSVWYLGTVISAKAKKGCLCRVRIKFDMYPKDKFDKWYDHPSADLRVLKPVGRPARKSPSPSREVPSTTTFETPNEQQEQRERQKSTPVQSPEDNRVSSMSDATNITVAEEKPSLQKIPGMFRRCMLFFAPPEFKLTKENIKKMSNEELSEFPLEEFCDCYEKGIAQLIQGYKSQMEEAVKNAEAAEERLRNALREKERATTQLLSLRRNAAKLFRSVQEDPSEFRLSEGDVSDRVDEMVEQMAQVAQL